MNKYIGHTNQIAGVEEMTLTSGKSDGLKMLYVRNGNGLELWISKDRCADISRITFKGDNLGYFSPCGYVSPKYYDKDNFLKSFTAGFLTTCGLDNVGISCTEDGVEYPMHGTVSNMPCDHVMHWCDNDGIHIKATVRDAQLFSYKLLLEREFFIPFNKNEIHLTDRITNIGSCETPMEILYHCNMGYPLLDENIKISVPAVSVEARNEHAQKHIDERLDVCPPQRGYEEMCYFYRFEGKSEVSVYNDKIKKGINICFDADELKCLTQWNMFGEYDYVLGLEPGNCYPDGRVEMRKRGLLETLKPEEEKIIHLKFEFTEEEKC